MPFIKHTPLKGTCLSPDHNPPSMIMLEPGHHVWQCPSCGAKQTIFVPAAPRLRVEVNPKVHNYMEESSEGNGKN